MRLGPLLRTAQTMVPQLGEARSHLQAVAGRVLRRPVEPDFRALPLLGLPPGALHLDVGANRGRAIDAIEMFADAPSIIAFEPNPLLAARLRRRSGIVVHEAGLADEPGTFVLHVPVYNGYTFDGLASFDPGDAEVYLSQELLRFDPAKLEMRRLECRAIRLDDLELAPAFVKIDVQGFELQALLGARETLAAHHPALLIESPGPEIVELLAGLGYGPYDYDGTRLVPGVVQGLNTFFLST